MTMYFGRTPAYPVVGARNPHRPSWPFSKQGVMRATRVSPLVKRIPEPKGRSITMSGTCPLVGMFAMSRYGATSPFRRDRGGLTSIISGSGTISHPSGIFPNSDSTSLSEKDRPHPAAAGIPLLHLGANRVEIHEPRLEQCPRHLLQRLIHAPVEFNFVVEGALGCGRWPCVPTREATKDEAFLSLSLSRFQRRIPLPSITFQVGSICRSKNSR